MESEIAEINQEQLKLVKKLEEAMNILKYKQIKNVDTLENMKKPIDDLLSSLKFLPIDPPFSLLPTEIKTNILGYLCDSGALVAATVCQQWKEILQKRLNGLEKVTVGNHCSNNYECDVKCCIPEAVLKAVTYLKLDIHLTICHPLTEVDNEVVVEALTSVYKLSINGVCSECGNDDYHDWEPILTNGQKEQLLVGLENRSEIMDMVELRGAMEFADLDQDRLVNFLVNENLTLELDETNIRGPNLDIQKLIENLKDSEDTELTLTQLFMRHVQYPEDLAEDMADALCEVRAVVLFPEFRFKVGTVERLLINILSRPWMRMSCLVISGNIDWRPFISPDNLKTVLNKMMALDLRGTFTLEQLQEARSCPGVKVIDSHRISKWPTAI